MQVPSIDRVRLRLVSVRSCRTRVVSASGCSPVPKHRPHHRPRDRAVRHSAWPWAPILAFPEPPSQGLRSQVRCCRIATTDAVVVDARSAWLRPPLAWPPCKSRGHGLLQPSVRRSVGLAGHPVCAGVRCREDCCNHPRRWQAVRLASTSLRVTVFVGKNRKMLLPKTIKPSGKRRFSVRSTQQMCISHLQRQ